MDKNLYKTLGIIIKIIIAVCCLIYIYIKLIDSGQLNTFDFLLSANQQVAGYLLLVFFLMLANWSLEMVKWKILVEPHEPLSFLQCGKSVLAGITMSIFTPNRVGEFGGKIFFLKNTDRIKALLSSIIGSFGQLCVTVFFGSLAMLLYFLMEKNKPAGTWMIGVSLLFFLSVIFIMSLYLYPKLFVRWFSKYKNMNKYMEVFTLYSGKKLLLILQLSFSRYIIFSLQFFLLLQLFLVEINPWQSLMMIALTFLGITIIPTITITELGVRGSAALLFLGEYSSNHAGIIGASFALWLINIALPALAGIPFVFNLTFFRNR